jgi:hypothetical protein
MPPSNSAQTSRDYPTTLQVGSCVDLIAVGLGARSGLDRPTRERGAAGDREKARCQYTDLQTQHSLR